MLENDIELGESLFSHRKSNVHLLTKTVATVLPLTSMVSQETNSIVVDLIESAELWSQLGYEASQVHLHEAEHIEAEKVLQVDFELRSQQQFQCQSWCPLGTASWDLKTVQLRLHFVRKRHSNEDADDLISTGGRRHVQVSDREPCSRKNESFTPSQTSFAEVESARCQLQPSSTPHLKTKLAGSGNHHYPTKSRPRQLPLDEAVLSALIDASLRSIICLAPIRLTAGVKCLTDQGLCRLCELAPAIFVPNHLGRLGEQANFIPGISRLLSKFLKLAEPATLQPSGGEDSQKEIEESSEIQKQLWNTLESGIRNHGSARKLQPLRGSGTARVADHMLDFPHTLSPTYQAEAEVGKGFCFGSEQSLDDEASGDADLFDLCIDMDDQTKISVKTVLETPSEDVDCDYSLAKESLPDIGANGRQPLDKIHDYTFEEEEGAGPLQHESRKYSNSMSQISDVSMLLPCERPMKDGRIVQQPQAIGGSTRLTQNVIRMHPLRQQQHESNGLGQEDLACYGGTLYERPDLSWWSDAGDASESPLEDYHYNDTKAHANNVCPSFYASSEEDAIHEYLDVQCDSREEHSVDFSTTQMSARELGEDSNGSLAEVIGGDHLLWHMWKRRASVAPRGEEDVTDLKALFATDPDMKLFGSRWDLDPSDISSGSNEDPMLHETTYNPPHQDKSCSPMSPSSERRSYFTPTRNSSSSGYVGRSSTDPSRRSSLIKRFTWGGRHNSPQAPASNASKLDQRTVEVKRRKTLDDYETMDKEVSNDDSGDMLF